MLNRILALHNSFLSNGVFALYFMDYFCVKYYNFERYSIVVWRSINEILDDILMSMSAIKDKICFCFAYFN